MLATPHDGPQVRFCPKPFRWNSRVVGQSLNHNLGDGTQSDASESRVETATPWVLNSGEHCVRQLASAGQHLGRILMAWRSGPVSGQAPDRHHLFPFLFIQ
jgi:hypothetical protein